MASDENAVRTFDRHSALNSLTLNDFNIYKPFNLLSDFMHSFYVFVIEFKTYVFPILNSRAF